ncbi:D-glycerate dehydrogenase [Novosphingobium sp.]|uniref:2-hydroxyacid dehydrogenase n=1 Tax=Novosphingobium sp. TaxID=1874826 RepID=UPI001ECC2BA0|nr:D-glycerate dehydrogenase [Novosphingobium sp.]MBK9011634.1 D-glycerate dehydrogenase [Novosphingobium sp.]
MTVVTDTRLARRVEGRPRVHVTRRLLPSIEARMGELFDVVLNAEDRPLSRAELVAAMREADVLVPTVTDRINAAMLEEAGDRLGLIANFGAGIEHIDLNAARARKVIVTNTPGVFTDDTADVTMMLILSVPRRVGEGSRLVRDGKWTGWAPSALLGHRIAGRRLAILGMGRIGQAVAHRARAFGLEIVYHNRHRLPASLENMLGARYEADIDTLIAEADILTLHCPAARETHHVLNAARIASMKPDSFVINTARGELIDEEALITALEQGRLGGAGLDVYAREPQVDPRLIALPNVITLPHLGSATIEGREHAGEKVIANIRFWADGHRPPDQVLEGWA